MTTHVCINMFTQVNDLSAAQFVTINVDGTVTSKRHMICVVILSPQYDPVGQGVLRACACGNILY